MKQNTQQEKEDALYTIASAQEGLFTTKQAADAGYSQQLLTHHVRAGRFERKRRGIYRLSRFPLGEQEELIAIWLWSEQKGIFSHQTALSLHQLSDVLPPFVELTLPQDWKSRRMKVPQGVRLYFQDVADFDVTWVGAVPVTTPRRTLSDCVEKKISNELIEQAKEEARNRGLI